MPASLAEQIAQRGEAIALTIAALSGRVYRDRQDAFTREESPALIVEHVDEDTTPVGGPVGPFTPLGALESNDVRIAFVACARAASWQTVADGVRVTLHQLLLADAALRSLCTRIQRDRCEWKAASADQPFGYCAQIYTFKTLTRAHALDLVAT
jgi:hypothetical protein